MLFLNSVNSVKASVNKSGMNRIAGHLRSVLGRWARVLHMLTASRGSGQDAGTSAKRLRSLLVFDVVGSCLRPRVRSPKPGTLCAPLDVSQKLPRAGRRVEAPSPHTTGLGDGASEGRPDPMAPVCSGEETPEPCAPPPGRDGPANTRVRQGFLGPFESRRLRRDLHSHRPQPWPPREPHRPDTGQAALRRTHLVQQLLGTEPMSSLSPRVAQ